MKILVVDDNADITDAIGIAVGEMQVEYRAVNDGRTGLQEIKNGKFDLIILDIAIPEFSGLDIMKDLKQNGLMDSLNIVVSTASSVSDSEKQVMMSLGAKDILPKPFRVKELKAMIQRFSPR
jgi:DNA-binding response OmpR family regulator